MSDAELAQRVINALVFSGVLGLAMSLFFYLGQIEVEGGPTRLDRWRADRAARRSVKRSVSGPAPYVTHGGQADPARSSFPSSAPTETEKRAEAETAETDPRRIVMDKESLDRMIVQARLEGGAEVFGALLGGGFLEPVRQDRRITQAKEFVFVDPAGKPVSGRMMTSLVNPAITKAEARAALRRPAAPEELRTVLVGGEREILL